MSDVVTELGELIDGAAERGDAKALAELAERCQTEAATHDGTVRVILRYFRANAFAGLKQLRLRDRAYMWGWDQPEAAAEIYALRQCVSDPAFRDLDPVRRCQVRTNLGNCLNAVGRPVEAIEAWTAVLAEIPVFAMALGNRGFGLGFYASGLYDESHEAILLLAAFDDFHAAVADGALWDSGYQLQLATMFSQYAGQVAHRISIEETRAVIARAAAPQWDNDERRFRLWGLEHRLFLNPLNDVGTWSFVAHDVLHLPSHSYSVHDLVSRYAVYYDQLKSEYVAARALLYEATQLSTPAYFDRDILLFDSLDYVRYGLATEKLKLAFRASYSIFDKVAAFLADYFKLSRPADDISFRTVFYVKGKLPRQLAPQFTGTENWPLRGLYSLSKDLYERSQQEVAEPDAQELYEDRNAAEHRFFSLHDLPPTDSGAIHRRSSWQVFESKTLRLLTRARAALIYLSLAVAREEAQRQRANPDAVRVSTAGVPYQRDKL